MFHSYSISLVRKLVEIRDTLRTRFLTQAELPHLLRHFGHVRLQELHAAARPPSHITLKRKRSHALMKSRFLKIYFAG